MSSKRRIVSSASEYARGTPAGVPSSATAGPMMLRWTSVIRPTVAPNRTGLMASAASTTAPAICLAM